MQHQSYPENLIIDQELQKLYLFAGLNESQFALIKKNMRHIRLEDGEYLFKHGQRAERFFMLKQGHIKLLRTSYEGEEKVFEIISPGQTFAEAIMFMPESTYPVTAQSINHTLLVSFENKVFMSILKDSSDTCFRLMFQMSKRLRMWINEIDHLTLQNATYRLVNYLLYQVPDNYPQKSFEINFLIPKHVVASRLSIKPETLSRILHCLNKKGLITVKGRIILIHDTNELRLYSHSEVIPCECS
ncbi:Crp/Fnr family transcriptional regulator [Candidatus Parabeggiatoa sp. HSG14]|uniref:Crp/Fnr family transcriptional regulator n=1 Tax=Candidatus Parabeggiatoa sp. HSG14 TaxID=3055593 RepID=UPI0025A74C1E|nr:Crp/Fnr family transcriptional regulator [Thiotrichales bacterium HSG14]